MTSILAFLIKYRSFLIGSAMILIITIAGFLWLKRHDNKVKTIERTACNAEWNIKELERQSVIDKANESARKVRDKNTQNSKKLTKVAVIDELSNSGWLRPD